MRGVGWLVGWHGIKREAAAKPAKPAKLMKLVKPLARPIYSRCLVGPHLPEPRELFYTPRNAGDPAAEVAVHALGRYITFVARNDRSGPNGARFGIKVKRSNELGTEASQKQTGGALRDPALG